MEQSTRDALDSCVLRLVPSLLSCAIFFMVKEKILVIGASGQIGVELTLALRKIYGNANVVASDLREENELLKGSGPYVSLDVMNNEMLHGQFCVNLIIESYLQRLQRNCNAFFRFIKLGI